MDEPHLDDHQPASMGQSSDGHTKDTPPSKEIHKPKAFLAMRFDPNTIYEEQGEALIKVLQEAGLEVSCLVRDEKWGKNPSKHPVQEAFERIRQSEILIIDASRETGFGTGAEAGYAKALGKPVIMICPEGIELKATQRDIADTIVMFNDLNDLSQKLTTVIQGLNTHPN